MIDLLVKVLTFSVIILVLIGINPLLAVIPFIIGTSYFNSKIKKELKNDGE